MKRRSFLSLLAAATCILPDLGFGKKAKVNPYKIDGSGFPSSSGRRISGLGESPATWRNPDWDELNELDKKMRELHQHMWEEFTLARYRHTILVGA